MSRGEFFDGLDSSGVQITLSEYVSAGWKVSHFGENEDGFWMVLEVEA